MFRVPALAFAWSAALVAGCGTSIPETVPVSGVVFYNEDPQAIEPDAQARVFLGAPVAGAKVTFHGQAKLTIYGMTDANGRFRLKTYVDEDEMVDGVPPGAYQVSITKLPMLANPETKGAAPALKPGLPERYANSATSKLAATVALKKEGDDLPQPHFFTFSLTP